MAVWGCLRTCVASVSFGIAASVPAVEALAQAASPVGPPSEEDAPAVVRIATAPAGSKAEAIPEVPTPPTFPSPNAVLSMPDFSASAVQLKKASVRYTLLAGRANDMGMDLVDGEATFGFRNLDSLTITPSAGVVFLDGPTQTDLPPSLYNGQLEFRWFGQIATPVFYELSFMPAIFTDGNNVGSDALRLQGRGVGYLAFSEQTQLVLGATYLDRKDVPLLPVFGVLHSVSDDLKLELVFPRPRILRRVSREEGAETWAYAAGELGGGSWAVERANGGDDIASYRDFRFLLGLEQKQLKRWSAAIEAGYVFGRHLAYESERGDFSPSNTMVLRLALSH